MDKTRRFYLFLLCFGDKMHIDIPFSENQSGDNMDIQYLNEMIVLEGSKTLTEAARKIGISTSLLAAHISQTENLLGVSVIERSSRGIHFTEEGKRFLAESKSITKEYRQMISMLGGAEFGSNLHLRLCFSGFVMPGLVGPYLDSLNLRYPDMKLDVYSDSDFGIEESLDSGKIDIYFSYAPEDFFVPGITKEALYSTNAVVLVPFGHHLSGKAVINTSDLEEERFVLSPRAKEPVMRDLEESLLQKCGINYSVYSGHVCSSAHYIMVPIGKGLVLAPHVNLNVFPPNTTSVFVNEPFFKYTLYMFYREDHLNDFTRSVIEEIKHFQERSSL